MNQINFYTMKRAFWGLKPVMMVIGVVTLILTSVLSAGATTFYTYTNEKGTMVFTQTLAEVPSDHQENAEKIILPEAQPNKKRDLGVVLDQIKSNKINGKKRNLRIEDFSSFFKDGGSVIAGFVFGGIILWFVFAFILKRFPVGFFFKLVLKLTLVVVLCSGIYIVYLSWMTKSVLDFNQVNSGADSGSDASTEQSWVDQITTPEDILERTQSVVDQLNDRIKAQEKALRESGIEARPRP